jgi:hypothetical protein
MQYLIYTQTIEYFGEGNNITEYRPRLNINWFDALDGRTATEQDRKPTGNAKCPDTGIKAAKSALNLDNNLDRVSMFPINEIP